MTAPCSSLLVPYTSDPNYTPLPTDEYNPDGKSLTNPPRTELSSAYEQFPEPIDSSNNGFDFHVYYMPTNEDETQYARELHERIRREFPELRIYSFWDRPVGPHPTAQFKVDTFTPQQTGMLFSWLTVHRGPCSVLIHPNTGEAHKDHTELMSWMGHPWPLLDSMLKLDANSGFTAAHANAQAQTNNIDSGTTTPSPTSALTAPAPVSRAHELHLTEGNGAGVVV